MAHTYRSRIHTDVHTGLADITDSGALHHVPHGESLDGLIFGHTTRAVRATDWIDMATALLVATVISSLFRLWDKGLVHREMIRLIHPQSLHPSSNSSVINRCGAKRTAKRWHRRTAKMKCSPLSVVRRVRNSCRDDHKVVLIPIKPRITVLS